MTKRNKLEASSDLIEEFQLIVRRYKLADEKTIELTTEMCVSIAEALKYVRRPGRPTRGRTKVAEAVTFQLARGRLAELTAKLKSEAEDPAKALDLVVRELQRQFPKLAPKTIKRRLGR